MGLEPCDFGSFGGRKAVLMERAAGGADEDRSKRAPALRAELNDVHIKRLRLSRPPWDCDKGRPVFATAPDPHSKSDILWDALREPRRTSVRRSSAGSCASCAGGFAVGVLQAHAALPELMLDCEAIAPSQTASPGAVRLKAERILAKRNGPDALQPESGPGCPRVAAWPAFARESPSSSTGRPVSSLSDILIAGPS